VWTLHLSLFLDYAVARRYASVSPLKDEEGRTQFESYSAVFEGEPALIKLLYDNHESAAVHAAWANVGLAPPLLLSERVHALAAKHVRFGKRIGEVDHITNVHTVRSCLALPGVWAMILTLKPSGAAHSGRPMHPNAVHGHGACHIQQAASSARSVCRGPVCLRIVPVARSDQRLTSVLTKALWFLT